MGISKHERIINKFLKKDIDFVEVFYEDTKIDSISLINQKISKIDSKFISGLGLRIVKDEEQIYTNTNILEDESINNLINETLKNYKDSKNPKSIKLTEEIVDNKYKEEYLLNDNEKVNLLHSIDDYARRKDNRINQVQIILFDETQKVKISNSKGKYIKDIRNRKRLDISIYIKENKKQEVASARISCNGGYELINKKDYQKIIDDLIEELKDKINGIQIKGGQMPVVIGNGFGGVIFHEACGHPLETSTISKGIGIFVDKLNQKIASSKVTLIDDATVENSFGSTNIDDEGNITKRNILIKDGILKNYLSDEFHAKRCNVKSNSSCRRESYRFCPTSRMSNTFLAPSNDSIDDMIKSIDYGIYAKKMGGGSVNPITGDFNFTVKYANVIRNGKICEAVGDICLIGNGADILKNVEMVSNDLDLVCGYCGAESGLIPTTVGQPTIKVSNITVGGRGE